MQRCLLLVANQFFPLQTEVILDNNEPAEDYGDENYFAKQQSVSENWGSDIGEVIYGLQLLPTLDKRRFRAVHKLEQEGPNEGTVK